MAQAQVEGLTIISNDTQLDGYAVSPNLEASRTNRSLLNSPIAANPKPFYGLR